MINIPHKRQSRRDGVALVMVLGFLSVLVLLAVGFAISMRIERLASQNYSEVVKSRQLVYAALTRAQADIDIQMMNSMYPAFPGYRSSTGSINLITGSASNYIPRAVYDAAINSLKVGWKDMKDNTGRLHGRYAYSAVDCSGLVDINLDGTSIVSASLPVAPSHGLGASARELYLDAQVLPELVAGREVNVKVGRLPGSTLGENTPWMRMESVAEINPILAYYGSDSPMLANTAPSNFFVYSRSPPGWLQNGTLRSATYLGTNDLELAAQLTAIRTELQGMTGVFDVNMLMTEIGDYADTDFLPGVTGSSGSPNVSIPCMEPIPMFNEVALTSRLYVATGAGPSGGNLYSISNQVLVELWYPFVGVTNPMSYSVEITCRLQPNTMSNGPLRTTIPLAGPWNSPRFVTVTNNLLVTTVDTTPNWSGVKAQVTLALKDSSGNVVDQASSFQIDVGSAIGAATAGGFCQSQVADDPRINWNGTPGSSHWKSMTPNTHSIGLFNLNYCTALDPNKDFAGGSAAQVALYVANQPFRSVGEMGLLLNYDASKPTNCFWNSIRLIDSAVGANDSLPVLDRFTVLPTGTVARGKINMNSPFPGPLATAFNRAPMEAYPGEPAALVPTLAELGQLATRLRTTGPYTNVSEIARLTDANVPGTTPAKKEGLIRNTANLLTTRQNIFTLIVAAQTGVDGNRNGSIQDNEVTAEQRALVVVWRDPFPNAQGRHDSFVRFFRWLTD